MEAYKSLIKKIDRVYDEIKILQNPADQIQREWCSTSEAAKVLGVTAEREGTEPSEILYFTVVMSF